MYSLDKIEVFKLTFKNAYNWIKTIYIVYTVIINYSEYINKFTSYITKCSRI